MRTFLIFLISLFSICLMACPNCGWNDCSCMPGYDTTWVENGVTCRQRYINDGVTESFYFLKGDSVKVSETRTLKSLRLPSSQRRDSTKVEPKKIR